MLDLNELIARARALEQEAFATITNPATGAVYAAIDTFPGFFYTSEAFPYTTHRVAGYPIDHSDNNEGEQFPNARLVIRVVIGHLTTGYKGEPDERVYDILPPLVNYLSRRKWFQTVPAGAYPNAMNDLIYSEAIDAGGFMVFDQRGFAGVSQVGFELVIACRFTESIEQVYF